MLLLVPSPACAQIRLRVRAGKGQPLTLVLTDVEGGAELWEWDPAVMAEARKLHDAVLRSRLRRFHGCAARMSREPCMRERCLAAVARHCGACQTCVLAWCTGLVQSFWQLSFVLQDTFGGGCRVLDHPDIVVQSPCRVPASPRMPGGCHV